MFLLEEMPWMKWRESRPHSHTPNKALTNTQKRLPLHISPLQHFCPNSGFQLSSDWIYPLWHIQSAKAAVGRLADWWCDYHHQACWLRAVLFFPKKKKRHMHTRWHRHMCAQKHGCIQVLYGMIDMFDQHLLWSLWSALRSSVVCVLFTADIKFHEPWKEHQGIMSIIYQTLMTTLLEPSQITYHLNSTFNLIHLTSQNVNTPTDCCMLCLVHREISGLCMVVRDLHLNNHFCILYHSCDLLGGSIWCIFWYNLKI